MSKLVSVGVALTQEQVTKIDRQIARRTLDGGAARLTRSHFVREAVDAALAASVPASIRSRSRLVQSKETSNAS